MKDEQLFLGEVVVSKQRPSHFYMEINVKGENDITLNITLSSFQQIIKQASKELFGDLGAVIHVDVLMYNAGNGEGIIKVPSSGVVQIWSSLTWFSAYKDQRIKFNIIKVSPYLVSLSKNSRKYQHKKIDI